ncbi:MULTISPECIES: adenylate/guanylate cyclase domain-containing protein [Mesoflavibacter]|uniref:adenylate/guanylate cyclase domain-containing protein n=1 Tax=Mesoflavibacter TaxID=444051 RepID=UPI000D0F51A6|nr:MULTISPECIES: adenylate/guanylate cyclase domain-containing protein [Mesoflavibacter]QIJ89835.1 Adenylate cyclase [Mesoflavibacter sp. HG96]QIJ92563.1 Adenylate cyclase [Mesoflavibacter sp. HG37]
MRYYFIQFIKLLFSTTLFWSAAFCLYITIRYFAIGAEEGLEITDFSFINLLKYGLYLGVLIGLLYAIVEFVFDKFIIKNLSLAVILLIKFVVYLVGMIIFLSIIYSQAEVEIDLNLSNDLGWWQQNKVFWLLIGYFIICSQVFTFIKIANEKFGQGVFFNFLIGKYRKPREERRVFMFLDLKDSTKIAEQLGHYKYSKLIQSCFYDLNRIIGRFDAEIYQYVGDEAVLSWTYKKGVKHNNCVKLYYKFLEQLKRKEKWYLKHFGFIPQFKAGLHGGKLIVTEVGTIKKEIAYHGDVINTTARIQGECNKYEESLLISESLYKTMYNLHAYNINSIGEINLKGKESLVKIYAINPV